MKSGKQDNAMSLSRLDQQLTKTAQDTMSWQAKMRAVVANSISEEDIKAIVAKQVEKAKQGNESAAKFVLTHVLGCGTPVKIQQTNIITDPETAARLAKNAG